MADFKAIVQKKWTV